MQKKTNSTLKNSGQKNAVRYALITTATIATILGAQTLAFSNRPSTDTTDTGDTQSQQVVDVALDATTSPSATLEQQPTDPPSATPTLTATTVKPTGTLPPTNTPAVTATTVEVASSSSALSQDKQPVVAVTLVSVQNVASGVTEVAATTQPTATATVKPTSTAVPTLQPTATKQVQVTTARSQPNPRSKSSH